MDETLNDEDIPKFNLDQFNLDEETNDRAPGDTIIHIPDGITPSKKKSDPIIVAGNTGEWNKWTKLFLRKISDKAIGYRWMHDREYRQYESRESRARIIEDFFLAFVEALGGTTFALLVSGLDLNSNKTVLIVVSVIQIILGIILYIAKKIHQTGEYQRKEQLHKYTSGKFYDITLRIQTQFALDKDRRENDKNFLMNIIGKFNDIIQLALPIEKETIQKYIKAKEENDITLPINLGDIGADMEEVRPKLESKSSEKKFDNEWNLEVERWLKNV